MKRHISPEVLNALIKVISSCNGVTEIQTIATEAAALFALEHGKPAPREEIGYAIAAAFRDANESVQNSKAPDGSFRMGTKPHMLFQLSNKTAIPIRQATKENLMAYRNFRGAQNKARAEALRP